MYDNTLNLLKLVFFAVTVFSFEINICYNKSWILLDTVAPAVYICLIFLLLTRLKNPSELTHISMLSTQNQAPHV